MKKKYYHAAPSNGLTLLFHKQRALQKRLGTDVYSQQFITTMTVALIDELMEALRETPWKPWKKQQAYNREAFKNELIDAWHFLINLSLASGMTANEVIARYLIKNKENHGRKKRGY